MSYTLLNDSLLITNMSQIRSAIPEVEEHCITTKFASSPSFPFRHLPLSLFGFPRLIGPNLSFGIAHLPRMRMGSMAPKSLMRRHVSMNHQHRSKTFEGVIRTLGHAWWWGTVGWNIVPICGSLKLEFAAWTLNPEPSMRRDSCIIIDWNFPNWVLVTLYGPFERFWSFPIVINESWNHQKHYLIKQFINVKQQFKLSK